MLNYLAPPPFVGDQLEQRSSIRLAGRPAGAVTLLRIFKGVHLEESVKQSVHRHPAASLASTQQHSSRNGNFIFNFNLARAETDPGATFSTAAASQQTNKYQINPFELFL